MEKMCQCEPLIPNGQKDNLIFLILPPWISIGDWRIIEDRYEKELYLLIMNAKDVGVKLA